MALGDCGFVCCDAVPDGVVFLLRRAADLGICCASVSNQFFAESAEQSLAIASAVLSPLSIWFLFWQFGYFVGPAYVDIIRSFGFFQHKAHHQTPKSALDIVRRRRLSASRQLSNFLNLLFTPFRSD